MLVVRDQRAGLLTDVTETVVRQQALTENAEAAGTTVAASTRAASSPPTCSRGRRPADFAQGVGFALAFLFYLASLAFGMPLAASFEEKQTRIVEIIATKIPVRQLLAGKVLGNTALALTQMALYAAIGLVGPAFTSFGSFVPALSGAAGSSSSSWSASSRSPACGRSPVPSRAAPRTCSRPRPR